MLKVMAVVKCKYRALRGANVTNSLHWQSNLHRSATMGKKI
jgi:hypothetical protein